jgi:hypothetical protein
LSPPRSLSLTALSKSAKALVERLARLEQHRQLLDPFLLALVLERRRLLVGEGLEFLQRVA